MRNPFPSTLISPTELANAMQSPQQTNIIPIAAGKESLRSAFETQHIPGSIFFNMDIIADTSSAYPQMLPTASHFAKCMGEMGVEADDVLVFYDAVEVGMYSAPRAAWTCRFFGHENVHVLNNFPVYVGLGYPVQGGEIVPRIAREYPVCGPDLKRVIGFEELREMILSRGGGYRVIDARVPGRFAGTQGEVDPGLRAGHMPFAVNVPLAEVLSGEKVFLSAGELRGVFERVGVWGEEPVVLTCNSGVTAAALDLALGEVFGDGVERRVYDGSWMEWTRRAEDGLVVVD
ncbi:Rhodanese-like domain-containing protein [Aspergillus avenaceus]|uniref:Rhodanese-like domain-containing protein n=1 Tax=Aspergillus avenaceus TaxID=36643 RepID=A0A5N6U6T3_ASPAV|nr:Rhodanese-like domain-containing protein [Aspergillus avenaceus]